MTKLRNRIKTQAKLSFRKPYYYLLSVMLLAILSTQIDSSQDLEKVDRSEEVQVQQETEAFPSPPATQEQSSDQTKKESNTTTATGTSLSPSAQQTNTQKLASKASVSKLSSAVAYKSVQAQLLDFSGKLNWTSSFQRNLQSFQIERSMDDEYYEQVGSIDAEGFGEFAQDISYTFQDSSLMFIQIPRIYYRITQIGMDGKKGYSDVQELDTGLDMGLYGSIRVQDNQELILQYAADQSGRIQFEILDAFGKAVKSGELDAEYDTKSQRLASASFQKGTYYLKLFNETDSFMQPFVIH